MNCARCFQKINSFKPPFGIYICNNEHAHCAVCEFENSMCSICGQVTKYKSPHFLNDQSTGIKETKNNETIPKLHDIEPTEQEELAFQELRYKNTHGHLDDFICAKNRNPLKLVRTLSAIVARDLYTSNTDKGKIPKGEGIKEQHYHKIVKALRETGCQKMYLETNDTHNIVNTQKCKISSEPSMQSIFKTSATSVSNKLPKIKLKMDSKHDNEQRQSEIEQKKITLENGGSILNLISLKSVSCENLIRQYPHGLPIVLETTSLDRRPFQCPIDSCKCKIFISDFIHHIISNHPTLPLANINFGQFKEIFLDVYSCKEEFNNVACFLTNNIVKSSSKSPLQNVLPMILMNTRHFTDDCQDNSMKSIDILQQDNEMTKNDCFLIWLAGVIPEGCDIIITISVFSKENGNLMRWYVDSLNSLQDFAKNGCSLNNIQRLMLNYHEMKVLTNNFKEQLQCQIGVVDVVFQNQSS